MNNFKLPKHTRERCSSIALIVYFLINFISFSLTSNAQTLIWHDDGSLEVSGGLKELTSINPAIEFDYNTIPLFTHYVSGYIQAYTAYPTPYPWWVPNDDPIGTDSKNGVSVIVRGEGRNIYGLYNTGDDLNSQGSEAWFFGEWALTDFRFYGRSDNIKKYGFNAGTSKADAGLGLWRNASLFTKYPVHIIVRIRNARFKAVKIPGIGTFTAAELFSSFTVTKNGATVEPNNISAEVGDVLDFKVQVPVETDAPSIPKLAKTWIARFAGDLRYYVNSDHKQGGHTPWIGFDTQVHWLNLRNYQQEPNRQEKYPDWKKSTGIGGSDLIGGTTYNLSYTIPVPMQPAARETGYYEWDKFSKKKTKTELSGADKTLRGDAWAQRANQKEGLNMQILHYWNNDNNSWLDEYQYRNYDGLNYMMGFDDDEILYMGSPNYKKTSQGKYAILKEPMRWQIVPKDEGTSVDDCINETIEAYYRFQAEEGLYEGHELQDANTTEAKPYGSDHWLKENGSTELNVSGPLNGAKINITATSPFKRFNLFQGPTVPAREEEVEYTLTELTGKQIYDKYLRHGEYTLTVEYETQDSNGSLKLDCQRADGWESTDKSYNGTCTHQRYSSKANSDLNTKGTNPFTASNISSNAEYLKFKFKTYADSYCSVSLYLENTAAGGEKVLMGGKQVYPVNLAFMEDQNLSKGTGEGGYFFVEQQRRVKTTEYQTVSPYSVSRGDRFVSPFVRTYTFFTNESSKWKVYDPDPHKFGGKRDSPDHDWYISNRTQSLRVFDEDIASDKSIRYYFDKISEADVNKNGYIDKNELSNEICHTRECDLSYASYTGIYQLTAIYRNGPPISHKIVVKNVMEIASVKVTDLSSYDFKLLNSLNHNSMVALPGAYSDYVVLEVNDLWSKFMFHIGQRNNYPKDLKNSTDYTYSNGSKAPKFSKVNRWGPYLDFNSHFEFWDGSNEIISKVEPSFLDNYKDATTAWKFDVTGQKDKQGNSDLNYDVAVTKFPELWGNHFSSLWKKSGPDGSPGPSYLPTSTLENDPNEFNNYLSGKFSDMHSKVRHYWQLRATLNSWSDSYGYRMRYNPSHIYDLSVVFNDAHGAFSGQPASMFRKDYDKTKNTGSSTYMRQPYPSDNYLNLQALVYDLKTGRKIIIKKSEYDGIKDKLEILSNVDNELKIYADSDKYLNQYALEKETINYDNQPSKKFVYLCTPCSLEDLTSSSGTRIADYSVKESSESLPPLSVYPVPLLEHMNVAISSRDLSPLYLGIYDMEGKMVWEYSGHVEKGLNELTIRRSQLNLTEGTYILKAKTQELTESRKFLVAD